MELRDILAANLRRRRDALGFSQEELADRAQIDRTHVSKIERSVHSPTVDVLGRLARALDMSPAELISEAPAI